MKCLFFLITLFFFSCSDEPVNMEEVLFERGGQYITSDNFSPYFFLNRKVYNGPAYLKYRTGEKREQGVLKNGFKSGSWTGWDKKGNKRFIGKYKEGKEDGLWTGFHSNGNKKYEGNYRNGLQTGKWVYFNTNGGKKLEETYSDLGRLIDSD